MGLPNVYKKSPNKETKEIKEIEVLLLKKCPRCHGDVQLKSDGNGKYLSCFQCGYMADYPGVSEKSREELKVLERA